MLGPQKVKFLCTVPSVYGKVTLEQDTKAQKWSRVTALLFLYPQRYMGVGGQCHAPATLPPGKGPSTHCIGGWVGPRAILDGCGKSHPHQELYTVYIYTRWFKYDRD